MKATFANMKLKVNTETKDLILSEDMDPIKVSQYLPINDKYDLAMTILQEAKEDSIYNPLKIDYLFHLYLIYMYTNISFTDKQKEEPSKIYDALMSNGIIDQVIELIPDSEYQYLYTMIESLAADLQEYNARAGAAIRALINDLPERAEAYKEIMESFDKEKYTEVINFAQAANGNRSIVDNQPIGNE